MYLKPLDICQVVLDYKNIVFYRKDIEQQKWEKNTIIVAYT